MSPDCREYDGKKEARYYLKELGDMYKQLVELPSVETANRSQRDADDHCDQTSPKPDKERSS